MTCCSGFAPAATSVRHTIPEADVWLEAKRLECLIASAGEDTTDLDLEGLAHQTLVRDLKERLTANGVTITALPWRGNGLTGDLEIECHLANETDAVFAALALG